MINWKLLYDKFGRLNAAKKFEDLALDYVCDVYNEYTWKPTQRTRDGNRDFHNLEEDLLKIWGEAKYKKDSISLTRKDLDPTILSAVFHLYPLNFGFLHQYGMQSPQDSICILTRNY